MHRRLIGAAVPAVLLWVVTTVVAIGYAVPLVPGNWVKLNATDPFPGIGRPTVDLFGRAHLVGMAVGIALAGVVVAVTWRTRRRTAGAWIAAVLGSGTAAISVGLIIVPNPPGLLWTIPAAGCAGWLIYRLQRHRRLPLLTALGAYGWGLSYGFGVALILQMLFGVVTAGRVAELNGRALTGDSSAVGDIERLMDLQLLQAPVFEELAKAVGIWLIMRLVYDRYPGVHHGIVVGALVGAGFNFTETLRFAHTSEAHALHQIWLRQWVGGTFFAHTLLSALVGAGIAIAFRRPRRLLGAGLVAAAYLVAVGNHFAWNWLAEAERMPWSSQSPYVAMLVVEPLNFLTVQGPLLVVVAVLWWTGTRQEAAALRITLRVEAVTGLGAVTYAEAHLLRRHRTRQGLRFATLTRHGPRAFLRLDALQRAQLELVMARWLAGHEPGLRPAESEQHLRATVARRRAAFASAVIRAEEVPA